MGRFLPIKSPNIALPFPNIISGKKGIVSVANVFPHPSNDGSTIKLPTVSTSSLIITNAAGTALYTIAPTALNAASTDWFAFWLDTVDGCIYVLATSSTAGRGYFGKIDYTTGVVTQIGTMFTGQTNTLTGATAVNLMPYWAERSAMGSGDLTFWNHGNSYRFSVSSTTGAVTVAEALYSVNSIAPSSVSGVFVSSGIYQTVDLTVFAYLANDGVGAGGGGSRNGATAVIFRGGSHALTAFSADDIGGFGSFSANGAVPTAMPWGPNTVIIGGPVPAAAGGSVYGPRVFSRASFDLWLTRIANDLGLPT